MPSPAGVVERTLDPFPSTGYGGTVTGDSQELIDHSRRHHPSHPAALEMRDLQAPPVSQPPGLLPVVAPLRTCIHSLTLVPFHSICAFNSLTDIPSQMKHIQVTRTHFNAWRACPITPMRIQ